MWLYDRVGAGHDLFDPRLRNDLYPEAYAEWVPMEDSTQSHNRQSTVPRKSHSGSTS